MDRVFLGLTGLLLRISLGLSPQEIPRSSPASTQKTPSIPPLLFGLTQYIGYEIVFTEPMQTTVSSWLSYIHGRKKKKYCWQSPRDKDIFPKICPHDYRMALIKILRPEPPPPPPPPRKILVVHNRRGIFLKKIAG